jgi:hypothetical protein
MIAPVQLLTSAKNIILYLFTDFEDVVLIIITAYPLSR